MEERKKIKVILKRVKDKYGKEIEIPDTLKKLQELVGGYIETLTLRPGLVAIFNEEGRLRGMDYNCRIDGVPIVGPVLIAGADEEGELQDCPISISEWIERWMSNSATE